MNPPELTRLARQVDLEAEAQFDLRLQFGVACIERVEHLLTDAVIIDALATGKRFVAGKCDRETLNAAARATANAARSHAGSNSLDGSGNAAVSTSYAVAAALAGRALAAAEYAAYAAVYSYSAAAVTDPEAYRDEQDWQFRKLAKLTDQRTGE